MALLLSTISLLISHCLWVHPKYTWSRKDVGSPKSTAVWSTFHIGLMFCFFPANFMSSTYTDKNNPFSRCTNKHSQLETFSQPCCKRTFSNCLSHNSPAKGWPHRFCSRGTTGSSTLDHDLGQLCRGRRIQMSGHSDFGIFNNLGILHIYLGRRRYCVCCLSIASRQSGDDIHDFFCCHLWCWWSLFSEYCIRPPYRPLQYHHGVQLDLYIFWCFASNSAAFFKWKMSISEATWTFAPFVPCFIDHHFLTSDFGSVPRRNLFKFLPFFIHCCLCYWNSYGLRHRNKFVNQIVML